MSPVFRHGSLRLYLLKLLDEAPRHGYEVIRLLQDRFLGVYAPSPGTIYPRLARLEEEGLVTHDESDGRKVYRITEAGREELRARLDDLNELEEEITASIRDIAREVTEDVRETVRSLREELAWAARDVHRQAHRGRGSGTAGRRSGDGGQRPGADERERAGSAGEEARDQAREQARTARDQAREQARTAREQARSEWEQARSEWERAREQAYAERERARQQREETKQERYQAKRNAREQPTEEEHAPPGWHEHGQHERGRPWGEGGPGWGRWGGGWGGWPGPHEWADPRAYRDLEKLARQFTRELRSAAWHAQAVSEDALRDLRAILSETLDRIKEEVFSGVGPAEAGESTEPGENEHRQASGEAGRPEPGRPEPGRPEPGRPEQP
jgi:DNA-binding PadR family transcriptional regulator